MKNDTAPKTLTEALESLAEWKKSYRAQQKENKMLSDRSFAHLYCLQKERELSARCDNIVKRMDRIVNALSERPATQEITKEDSA